MNLDFQNLYTELKYFHYQNDVFNKKIIKRNRNFI